MAITATGQITITNLYDATPLNAYISANQATTQTYDTTAQTYSPSYATTPLVLTFNVVKAGTTTSVVTNLNSVTWNFIQGATTTPITTTTNTATQYLSGSNNSVFNNKVNISSTTNNARFTATANYTDPVTGLVSPVSAQIDINVVQLALSPLMINTYAPNGDTFQDTALTSLTVNADLYKGGSISAAAKSFKWFRQDSSVSATTSTGYDAAGGIGWAKVAATTGTTGAVASTGFGTSTVAQGVLTVFANDVVTTETYKVVATDLTGGTNGQSQTGFITIKSYTSPITISVESTAGDVFKNGTGSTTLNARVFQGGQEVDAAGTAYLYNWSKYDSAGALVTNFGGASVQYKTGKTLAVSNADITAKATFKIELNTK